MTKEDRLKKCWAVYDMGHIKEWKAIETAKMMCDFAMRFWDCVLIHPELYDMFYKYIKEQPDERNTMKIILRNLEEFKKYFKPNSKWEDKATRGKKENTEWKRLSVNKRVPSLYNPIMMLSRLSIPCVDCACDENIWETRRGWLSQCKHK